MGVRATHVLKFGMGQQTVGLCLQERIPQLWDAHEMKFRG